MKTFTERYVVLKDILKFWKLGKNIKVSCSGDNLAEGDSKNLTIESECQEQENEIKKTDANQKILEEGTSESNAMIKVSSIRNKILIRDNNCVDFNRIEKYFQEETGLECLKVCEQKKRSKWMCSTCQKVLAKNTDSLVCGRYLKWCHLSCTNLEKILILTHWYCKLCTAKYSDG